MESSGNSSTLRCKDGLKLNVEKSSVKENQTKKVNSSSLFSAKKPASNIEAVTATKRTLETNVKLSGASRTFRRGLLRGDSSFKNSGNNTAAEDKRIECSRMMRKSMSFSSNATDAKVKPLASNFSLVEDLKKLNLAKWNSTQGKYTSVLQSKVSSPVANSGVSASVSGNEIVSHGTQKILHLLLKP
ncbi:hypothetical protein CFP56_033086 [Quercus suber]|uniref:Uncharacterized protein n=1 Tax=Quercus suber TaxID=58331 RepID=A0AAW0JEX8_QUESU